MSQPLLSVRDLETVVTTEDGDLPVVRGVSFDVHEGDTVALVGESGSGKSMTMLSVMGLHPQPPARIAAGEVVFDGTDLVTASAAHRRAVRGAEMAMVYQDPMTSLNPLMRVGDQIVEALRAHDVARGAARERTLEVLAEVGIPQPARAAQSYPHEYSGGMRQRVVIAMALALRPRLLIADEPTTALDVTIQQQIIALMRDLQARHGMAVVWITHDLGVVARIAERTMVMYAGQIVEHAPTVDLFERPQHPYTDGLLHSIPPVRGATREPLEQIPGTPPDPGDLPSGCPFHPRCPQSVDRCRTEMPPLTDRDGDLAACWVPPEEWT